MKKLIISLLGAISFLTCNADKKEIVKYEFAYGSAATQFAHIPCISPTHSDRTHHW